MLEQLPLQHLMEMFLERPPPGEPNGLLLAAQPGVQVGSIPLGQQVNAKFGVTDRFAVELYPRVLAFRSLSRVVFNHLFVWDSGQLKPSEQLDREWSCRGQPPVGRECEDAEGCRG